MFDSEMSVIPNIIPHTAELNEKTLSVLFNTANGTILEIISRKYPRGKIAVIMDDEIPTGYIEYRSGYLYVYKEQENVNKKGLLHNTDGPGCYASYVEKHCLKHYYLRGKKLPCYDIVSEMLRVKGRLECL